MIGAAQVFVADRQGSGVTLRPACFENGSRSVILFDTGVRHQGERA
jgi:hypothetical protein